MGGLTRRKTWFNPPFSSENACTKSGIWLLLASCSAHWYGWAFFVFCQCLRTFPFEYTLECGIFVISFIEYSKIVPFFWIIYLLIINTVLFSEHRKMAFLQTLLIVGCICLTKSLPLGSGNCGEGCYIRIRPITNILHCVCLHTRGKYLCYGIQICIWWNNRNAIPYPGMCVVE